MPHGLSSCVHSSNAQCLCAGERAVTSLIGVGQFGSLFTATNARESLSAAPVDRYTRRFTQPQQQLLGWGWGNQSGSVWFSTGVPRFQYVLVELFTLQRLKLLKLLNAPNSANTGQCLNINVTNSTTITVKMLLIHIYPPLSIPGTHLAV